MPGDEQLNHKIMQHYDRDEIGKLFEQRGLRWTIQRQLVLQAIQHHSGHLTVEDIYGEISQNFPSINRTTVYRTLEVLSEMGVTTVVNNQDDLKRYELTASKPHYHALCENCGEEIEITEKLVKQIQAEVWHNHGLKLHLEHFVGTVKCENCQSLIQN